jgi:hypothetical protein
MLRGPAAAGPRLSAPRLSAYVEHDLASSTPGRSVAGRPVELLGHNFRQFLVARDGGHDMVAGNLVRALFEEAMRWASVDADQDARRTAFLAEAAWRHRQVEDPAQELA